MAKSTFEMEVDPIKYMEVKKSAFLSNLTKENNCTHDHALMIYQSVIDLVNRLEKLRIDRFLTNETISANIDKLPGSDKELIENWLLKSLSIDDTYVYAYNILAQKTNRKAGYVVCPIKLISDIELLRLIGHVHLGEKKVADRWYALLHLILIYLGKENQVINPTKKFIIQLGKEKYGTGQEFYNQFRSIDLNNMVAYVKSIPNMNRNNWKVIITEISGKDADVISWLKKQPK